MTIAHNSKSKKLTHLNKILENGDDGNYYLHTVNNLYRDGMAFDPPLHSVRRKQLTNEEALQFLKIIKKNVVHMHGHGPGEAVFEQVIKNNPV